MAFEKYKRRRLGAIAAWDFGLHGPTEAIEVYELLVRDDGPSRVGVLVRSYDKRRAQHVQAELEFDGQHALALARLFAAGGDRAIVHDHSYVDPLPEYLVVE
jgi:hypothetical protein